MILIQIRVQVEAFSQTVFLMKVVPIYSALVVACAIHVRSANMVALSRQRKARPVKHAKLESIAIIQVLLFARTAVQENIIFRPHSQIVHSVPKATSVQEARTKKYALQDLIKMRFGKTSASNALPAIAVLAVNIITRVVEGFIRIRLPKAHASLVSQAINVFGTLIRKRFPVRRASSKIKLDPQGVSHAHEGNQLVEQGLQMNPSAL